MEGAKARVCAYVLVPEQPGWRPQRMLPTALAHRCTQAWARATELCCRGADLEHKQPNPLGREKLQSLTVPPGPWGFWWELGRTGGVLQQDRATWSLMLRLEDFIMLVLCQQDFLDNMGQVSLPRNLPIKKTICSWSSCSIFKMDTLLLRFTVPSLLYVSSLFQSPSLPSGFHPCLSFSYPFGHTDVTAISFFSNLTGFVLPNSLCSYQNPVPTFRGETGAQYLPVQNRRANMLPVNMPVMAMH